MAEKQEKKYVIDNAQLMAEWDWEKNNELDLDPHTLTCGSGKKVWWKCDKGHKWEARIADRSNQHNCPYCSGRIAIPGQTDLATVHPELLVEWDYIKNKILPTQVKSKAKTKVFWICKEGHSWDATIKNRVNGANCPYCTGNRAISGKTDIATLYPELLKEWNFELNKNLDPSTIPKYSNRIVWWHGLCGHIWKDSVNHRTQGRGCPICNKQNRTSFPEQAIYFYVKQSYPDSINGYSDIFDTSMEIDIYIPSLKIGIEYDGKAWHNTKNVFIREQAKYKICKENGIFLIRIRESSEKTNQSISDVTIYTQPSLDDTLVQLSKFLTMPNNINTYRDRLTIREQYLSRRKKNTLAANFPDLSEEWHPTKNGLLTPHMFFPKSSEIVWWKGKCGHEWEMRISDRTLGNGCPYCSNHRLLAGFNDLATVNPQLAAEWHPTMNGNVGPSNVLVNSTRKFWWKCKKGHEWEAKVGERNRGKGCPVCANKTVYFGYNDLASQFPDLIEEWDFDLNNDTKPSMVNSGSNQKVWWKCKTCGHIWNATITSRTHGSGCPKCAIIKSAESYVKTIITTRGALADNYPTLISEWNFEANEGVSPYNVTCNSKRIVWWKCSKCGFDWKATIQSRTTKHSKCPNCRKIELARKTVERSLHENGSLLENFPQIASEWHPSKNGELLPNKIPTYSRKKVWWLCSKGHEWQATVAARSSGENCPYCSSRKLLLGFNDLSTINPQLAAEWHPTMNGDIMPSNVFSNSSKKVWWLCSKGHEWQATVANRNNRKSGCPICAGNIVVPGVNDVFTTNPQIIVDWDFEKNTSITPKTLSSRSRKKVWWICHICGHKWEDSIEHRTSGRTCPQCSREKCNEKD